MLDLRDDQASGLRRSMSRRRGPVLALLGAGEQPQLAGRFARALAEGGTGLTLVAVDDERLARGSALPACEALVLARADTEGLATAYARIKVLVGRSEVGEVCMLFGAGGVPARRGHERLERMAQRFLGVGLAFGGAAPHPARSGAWRRLADGVADWAFSSKGGAGWRPQ